MMCTLHITYDLNSPGQKYAELYEAIKAQGDWWHHMESTWIVITSKSPSEVFEALNAHIDGTDCAFVVDISGQPYSGWRKQESWDWLREFVGP